MASTSFGQALLALLESDLATIGGKPLIDLLTNLQKDAGNILLQQSSILAFVAQAPSLGIQLEVQLEQQLLQLLITKLQEFMATKPV